MHNVKTKVVSAKNRATAHVRQYRGRYAAATTAAAILTVNYQTRVKSWNKFLEDHDLLDEYYQPEE